MNDMENNKDVITSILDTAISGCLAIDRQGNLVTANQNALKMLGYEDISELADKNIHHEIHMDHKYLDIKECFMFKAYTEGARYSGILTKFKRKSGEMFQVTVNAAPIIKDKNILGAIVYFKDITEELKEEIFKERLKRFVDQAEMGFIVTDTNGNIEYVNRGYSKISGYSSEELISQNMNIVKSGEHDAEFYKKFWSTITSGQQYEEIFINRKKSGEKYYEKVQVIPVKGFNGDVVNYMAIKKDITRERLFEEKMLETQKLESLGKLAGGIAHDFNNILTSMVAYLDMADEIAGEGSEIKKYIGKVINAEERAERLVNQILGFSRKQMIAPKIQDMSTLLEEYKKMLRRMIPEDIKIEYVINDESKDLVKIDTAQFHQMLLNLIVNSKDALDESRKAPKEIKISLEYQDSLNIKSELNLEDKKYAILKVFDNGTGIRKEYLEKIFDPFFTTKEIGHGSGLGLSSVYGILKQNGGDIDVKTKPGEFTEFTLYWPCAEPEEKNQIPEPEKTSKSDKTGNILIVDDEEMIRDIMRTTFARAGYEVQEAENGKDALEIIRKEDIHVVVTDITMPEMNGDMMAMEAVKIKKDLKFIFITGYDLKESDINKNIFAKVIQKPYRPAELLKAVKEISFS